MKEFLIGIALFIGAGLLLITQYTKIGDLALKDALALEKTPELMKEMSEKDPAGFAKTYLPCVERRYTVLRIARIFDIDYFMAVSKDTVEKYKETSLLQAESFGHVLHQRAMQLREKNINLEAFHLFKLHRDTFPNTPEGKTSANAVMALGNSHGMY